MDSKKLLEILTAELNGPEETVQPGFRSRRDWQNEWGCSDSHAKKLIDVGVKKGLFEVKRFKVRYPSGLQTVPHYRPTQTGKKAKAA